MIPTVQELLHFRSGEHAAQLFAVQSYARRSGFTVAQAREMLRSCVQLAEAIASAG
jgi:hypothetical protein